MAKLRNWVVGTLATLALGTLLKFLLKETFKELSFGTFADFLRGWMSDVNIQTAFSLVALIAPYAVAALIVAAVAFLFYGFGRRDRTQASEAEHGTDNDVPLIEAARRAYSETRQSVAGTLAEVQGETSDGILRWYAFFLVDKWQVPLRGQRPPSDARETIKYDSASLKLFLKDGRAWIEEKFGKGMFTELTVNESELRWAIEQIRQWPGEREKGATVPELREFIKEGRELVAKCAKERPGDDHHFNNELQTSRIFPHLLQYLSADFKNVILGGRTLIIAPGASRHSGFALRFIAELDRIEKDGTR